MRLQFLFLLLFAVGSNSAVAAVQCYSFAQSVSPEPQGKLRSAIHAVYGFFGKDLGNPALIESSQVLPIEIGVPNREVMFIPNRINIPRTWTVDPNVATWIVDGDPKTVTQWVNRVAYFLKGQPNPADAGLFQRLGRRLDRISDRWFGYPPNDGALEVRLKYAESEFKHHLGSATTYSGAPRGLISIGDTRDDYFSISFYRLGDGRAAIQVYQQGESQAHSLKNKLVNEVFPFQPPVPQARLIPLPRTSTDLAVCDLVGLLQKVSSVFPDREGRRWRWVSSNMEAIESSFQTQLNRLVIAAWFRSRVGFYISADGKRGNERGFTHFENDILSLLEKSSVPVTSLEDLFALIDAAPGRVDEKRALKARISSFQDSQSESDWLGFVQGSAEIGKFRSPDGLTVELFGDFNYVARLSRSGRAGTRIEIVSEPIASGFDVHDLIGLGADARSARFPYTNGQLDPSRAQFKIRISYDPSARKEGFFSDDQDRVDQLTFQIANAFKITIPKK